MSNKFTESAKKNTSASFVIGGREKIDKTELIKKYPNGVCITEFDIISNDNSTWPVFAFAEDDTKYFNGGSGMMDTVNDWADMFDGCIEDASKALKECGGVKIKFEYVKTQNGRDFCRPTVIDD